MLSGLYSYWLLLVADQSMSLKQLCVLLLLKMSAFYFDIVSLFPQMYLFLAPSWMFLMFCNNLILLFNNL